jgi:hypothetical protein
MCSFSSFPSGVSVLTIIVCAACTPIDSPRQPALDASQQITSSASSTTSQSRGASKATGGAAASERATEPADAAVAAKRDALDASDEAGPRRPRSSAADGGNPKSHPGADAGSNQRATGAADSGSDVDAGDPDADAGPKTALRWPSAPHIKRKILASARLQTLGAARRTIRDAFARVYYAQPSLNIHAPLAP